MDPHNCWTSLHALWCFAPLSRGEQNRSWRMETVCVSLILQRPWYGSHQRRKEEAGRCWRKSVCPEREPVWGLDLQSGNICAKQDHFWSLKTHRGSVFRAVTCVYGYISNLDMVWNIYSLSGRLDLHPQHLRSDLTVVAQSAGGLLLSKGPTVCAGSHLLVSPNVWKQKQPVGCNR